MSLDTIGEIVNYLKSQLEAGADFVEIKGVDSLGMVKNYKKHFESYESEVGVSISQKNPKTDYQIKIRKKKNA